jgi:RNA polymerase sigma-70 factor (ECF subfamily)
MALTRPDPVELLQRARAGDGDDLGRLLDLYRNYLELLARIQIGRRLRGKVDAQDLVQEVYLSAHRAFGRFRGHSEGEVVGWLRQILAATVVDLVRRYGAQRRDVRLERQLGDELDRSSDALGNALAASQTSPSQHAVRRERAVLLADALRGLPTDYADVIMYHHVDGLPFAEVAGRMGRSTDAVKKLWMRALARVRTALEEAV